MSTSVSPKKVIVLVGGSQNGKSTFVRGLGGDAVVADRDSVFSTTVECESFTFLDGALTIVDTPGTGDAQQDDDDDDDDGGGGGGGGGGGNRSLTDLEIRRKILNQLAQHRTQIALVVWCIRDSKVSDCTKRIAIFLRGLVSSNWARVMVMGGPTGGSESAALVTASASINFAIKTGGDSQIEHGLAQTSVRYVFSTYSPTTPFFVGQALPATERHPVIARLVFNGLGDTDFKGRAMAEWLRDQLPAGGAKALKVTLHDEICRRCQQVGDSRLFEDTCHLENVRDHLRVQGSRCHVVGCVFKLGHGQLVTRNGRTEIVGVLQMAVEVAAVVGSVLKPDLGALINNTRVGVGRALSAYEKGGEVQVCPEGEKCVNPDGCIGQWYLNDQPCSLAAVRFQHGSPLPSRLDMAHDHREVFACQDPTCNRSVLQDPFVSQAAADAAVGHEGCRDMCHGVPKWKSSHVGHEIRTLDGALQANREQVVGVNGKWHDVVRR